MVAFQSMRTPNSEIVLTSLLDGIAEYPADWVLILDRYHVIESAPVNQALTFLLDRLPVKMHLVITAHADQPIPLARRRVWTR